MNQLFNSDCLEVLKTLKENSIDSLITDPPAGISFMGKSWDDDRGGRKQWIAWMSDVMSECMRVMKPGAHGLVWALPRTSHWTATALEDAGFEIRDVITHLFGSGFPKSLDISKAIDKASGVERPVIGIKTYMDGDKIRVGSLGHKQAYKGSSFQESKTLKTDELTGPATEAAKQWQGWGTALKPASEHWILIRKKDTKDPCEEIVLSVIPNTQLTMLGLKRAQDLLVHMLAGSSVLQEEKEKILLVGKVVNGLDTMAMSLLTQVIKTIDLSIVSSWKNISEEDLEKVKMFITLMGSRQTIESKTSSFSQSENMPLHMDYLKPESENIILIRKPISEKTIAANVLKWGVGGINIDECRVETKEDTSRITNAAIKGNNFVSGKTEKGPIGGGHIAGRFPANLVLSCSDNCTEDAHDMFECPIALLDEQSGPCKTGQLLPHHKLKASENKSMSGANQERNPKQAFGGDSGGASRFFKCFSDRESCDTQNTWLVQTKFIYQAKASKSEKGTDNNHPTVKSLKLMQYLIKLITPPNGIILDPFMGSGSTGVAAKKLGFEFIGIEKEQEYFEIAEKRIQSQL